MDSLRKFAVVTAAAAVTATVFLFGAPRSAAAPFATLGVFPRLAGDVQHDVKIHFSTVTLPAKVHFETAWGINDAGAIVGTYYDSSNAEHGYMYANATLTNIDDPNGTNTQALSINDNGEVAGAYTRPSGQNHGFVEENGVFTDVGPPGLSAANGINKEGVVVGVYSTCLSCKEQGFIFARHHYTTVNVPGAAGTTISVINNKNIMGVIAYNAQAIYHSYLYDGKTFTKIDVPGATDSYIEGVNDQGDIAFSWDNHKNPQGAALFHNGKFTFFSVGRAETYVGELANDRTFVGTAINVKQKYHIYEATY